MKRYLLPLLGLLAVLPMAARSFTYTYEDKTLSYDVISENARTCRVKAGTESTITGVITGGNDVSGDVVIPSTASDGTKDYTVVGIGKYSFLDCAGLTSIVIPESVTSVDFGAFEGCTGLAKSEFAGIEAICAMEFAYITSNPLYFTHDLCVAGESVTNLVIPESVDMIGDYAFYGCSKLTGLTLPESLMMIGEYAFFGCDGLTSVRMPSSVMYVGLSAFQECTGLTRAEFESIESLCTIEFAYLYSNPLNLAHHLYIDGKEVTSVVIPESLTKIGAYAFYGCEPLTSVSIPASVTEIGDGAFDCPNLIRAEFANVESICAMDFGDVHSNPMYTARRLYIGGSEVTDLVIPSSVTSISYCAFINCTGLKSVTLPDGLTDINWRAFEGCTGLTSVVIPNSVTLLGSSVFSGCTGLKSVTLPNALTTIGSGAFTDCTALASITIPASVTDIGSGAFQGCTGLEWADFPSVEHMCKMRFYTFASNPLAYAKDLHINGEKVTDLVIPSTVESITENSFYGCDGITSLVISGSVLTIGRSAFADCIGLTQISIPASVTSIYANAFNGCTGLVRINVYGPTPDVSPMAFDDTTYQRAALYIPENSLEEYLMTNWALFRRIYVGSVPTKTLTDGQFRYRVLENPDHIEALLIQGDYSALKAADIPASFTDDDPGNTTEYYITGIGASAFEGCTELTEVTFSPESQINVIAAKAFSGCSSLTGSIAIPNSVSTIGAHAFDGCSSITAVTVGNSVTAIGEYAFRGCNALTKAEFPSLEALCGITFGDTNANPLSCAGHLYVGGREVLDLEVPGAVTSIGDATFSGCSSLRSVTIPESVTSIGANAFYYCHGFTSLSLPNTLQSIGYKAFDACRGLTEVTIPNSVTSLGAAAFTACVNLRKVTLGHSITAISNDAFDNCTSLTEVVIPPTITSIGDYAFWGCTGLSEIVLPPSLETIGADAFYECINLVKVVMGSRVSSIGDNAFSGVPVANLYITAPIPPEANDNVFDEYSGDLFLQGDPAGYATASCWHSFHYRQPMEVATELSVNTPVISGRSGDTFQLSATVSPANATLKNVYWHSTNPEIASVDQNGLVTLHADSPDFRPYAEGDGAQCRIVAQTLYSDGPVAEVTVMSDLSGISLVEADSAAAGIDYSQPYEVYNMQGIRVGSTLSGLACGVYIVRQGAKAATIAVK